MYKFYEDRLWPNKYRHLNDWQKEIIDTIYYEGEIHKDSIREIEAWSLKHYDFIQRRKEWLSLTPETRKDLETAWE